MTARAAVTRDPSIQVLNSICGIGSSNKPRAEDWKLRRTATASSGPGGVSLRRCPCTGSHLDSVPGGGAFDGPLGVASALPALDLLEARGVSRGRSLAITVFP